MRLSDKRANINYVRNELKQYNFLKVIIEGLDLRIDEMITAIDAYKSSPVEHTEGTSGDKYWKEPLRQKLSVLEEKKKDFEFRLNKIDIFLKSLNEDERAIIENIYIKNKTFLNECHRTGFTKRSLEWEVEKILQKFKII